MDSMNSAIWRKSSYSGGNGGNCVEAGSLPGAVHVRDTVNRGGVVLKFSASAWAAFAASIKNGDAA